MSNHRPSPSAPAVPAEAGAPEQPGDAHPGDVQPGSAQAGNGDRARGDTVYKDEPPTTHPHDDNALMAQLHVRAAQYQKAQHETAQAQVTAEAAEAALAALYDRHAAAAYGLALRTVQAEGAAQEIVQDVFLALWERPGRFDAQRGSVRAFLLVMVRSRAIDRLRRERPALALYDDAGQDFPLEDPQTDLPGGAEQQALGEELRAALSHLSAAHRETVERAYFRDESREEIASAMNVPVGTVKSRLKYALERLRTRLGGRGVGWSE